MNTLLNDKNLITERIILEPLTSKHATILFEILDDREIYKFIDEDPPVNVLQLQKRYEFLENRLSPNKDEIWLNWVLKLKQENKYVGTVQSTIYSNQKANIAYIISPIFWRKGYAYEACSQMLNYLFYEYRITEVCATVDTDNISSQKLLEKLNFTKMVGTNSNNDFVYVLKNKEFKKIC